MRVQLTKAVGNRMVVYQPPDSQGIAPVCGEFPYSLLSVAECTADRGQLSVICSGPSGDLYSIAGCGGEVAYHLECAVIMLATKSGNCACCGGLLIGPMLAMHLDTFWETIIRLFGIILGSVPNVVQRGQIVRGFRQFMHTVFREMYNQDMLPLVE